MRLSPPSILIASLAFLLLSALLLLSATTNKAANASISATPDGKDSTVTWGTDIDVGGFQSTSPDAVPFAYTRHKDPVLSIDPTDPNHVTAAYAYVSTQYGRASLYANSTDGGETWARGVFSDVQGMLSDADVNVAYGAHGVAYYSTSGLQYQPQQTGLFIMTSTTGLNWNTPQPVFVYTPTEAFYRTSLAVDSRLSGQNAGSVYLYWEYYNNTDPYYQGIWGAYSRDGGHTWSVPARVSDGDHSYAFGADSKVASDGSIYVASELRPGNVLTTTLPELYLNRSTDGGVTWGGDKMISGAPIHYIGGRDFKGHELTLSITRPGGGCGLIRINQYPSIGVAPGDSNTVYAVWNDSRWDTIYTSCFGPLGNSSDIAFSKTTDGGNTWTSPIRVNDDAVGNTVDQFMPKITVAPSGKLGVAWYDRRYDPDHANYDLAYSESTDGGATWSVNQRVSDVSSDPDQLQDYKGINDLGLRTALVYGPDYAIAGWLDTRVTSQLGEFFVDRGTMAVETPVPTETPVATDTPVSTGTSTATSTSVVTVTVTPSCTLQFEDVLPDSTFYPFVRCLACKGILSGYPCGGVGEPCNGNNDPYFRPNSNITRGQIAKVVSNAAGFNEAVSGQTFEDVPPGSTFYTFTERLASRNVMSGYPCGGPGEPCVPSDNLPYFRPNNNATRGQISKIVAIAADIQDPPGPQDFEDVQPGSTFYTYTQQLANLGVMSGYPCGNPEPCVPPDNLPYFRPNNNATRGQTSKIVSNTFFPTCNP